MLLENFNIYVYFHLQHKTTHVWKKKTQAHHFSIYSTPYFIVIAKKNNIQYAHHIRENVYTF